MKKKEQFPIKELKIALSNLDKILLKNLNDSKMELGLLGGNCGSFIFLLKRKKVDLTEKLNLFFSQVDTIDSPSLASGYVGFGWFSQYLLSEEFLEEESIEELLLQIDQHTYLTTLNFIKENNHDFLYGATGNAFYLLSRLKENNNIEKYLTRIVKNLNLISKKSKLGNYWLESDFYSLESNKNEKIINLSLSHGLASKIVLFSKLYEAKIAPELSKELLIGGVNFMLNSKNSKGNTSIFPTSINSSDSNFSRLAWCYGDLGIGIALWNAGVALGDYTIKQEALDICLSTTLRKKQEDTGVVDIGICHGTSGIAHIYSRMYHYTKRIEFKDAANYWIAKTLKVTMFEEDFIFQKTLKKGDIMHVKNDYGFLEGIAGVGLVLHSYLYPEEDSTWDRFLLLS